MNRLKADVEFIYSIMHPFVTLVSHAGRESAGRSGILSDINWIEQEYVDGTITSVQVMTYIKYVTHFYNMSRDPKLAMILRAWCLHLSEFEHV